MRIKIVIAFFEEEEEQIKIQLNTRGQSYKINLVLRINLFLTFSATQY
jgi:hypothetical protein